MSNQIVITSGAKLRDLDDVIIGTDGILSSVAFNVANGVPRLDENGKILVNQLPNSVMEFKGVWNASTNSPTLVNGTGNAGDVWLCNVAGTVDFGAGPIAFAVGDYAVYTGSVWARSSGATGTVTSVGVSRDGNALTITGSPVTSSGTINLGFSGDNTQYINGAGNLTTFPTLITSIGLTMPAAFNVSNSPLTANGTIGVSAAGYASQYIRGDGTLADFPTSGGGGSSVSYYFNGGTSQGTIGGTTYYEMSKTADTGTGVDFNKTGDGFIVAFLTDANDPNLLQIPAGNWDFEIYASMSANGGTPELYAELYVYDGTTFTLIATSSHEILYDGVNLNLYSFATAVPQTSLTVTDRLAIKLYADNSGGKTTTIHTQDSHLCQVITTFSTGLTALNGLTAQVQYFATGTSGNDFNIVSSVATHTFNIPSASATARGLITTGTQTIAGSKTITGTTTFTGGPILSDTNLTYANSGYTLVLQSPTLSVNRTVTLPNGTGTLALTSDISYPVTSVFGRTGAIVATSGDYNSDQVTEGTTNLYFTNTRARTAISLTTTGTTGASTYNNSTGVFNIPNYADQYVGTVTSVGLSAPTGFSVSGSPVTSSGTLALSFASGYSLPTNVKQSNWDDAYTWVAAFPTQTGNTGKFLTTDGSSLSWAANPLGTVTSVAMSVPTGLTVSGSPITTSGTLAVTLTSGYSIPTNASQSTWDTAYTNRISSLTTTGTSGAATLSSNTLNIPQYQAALTNPVTGTGLINRVAKFDSNGSTITYGLIYDDGGAIETNAYTYITKTLIPRQAISYATNFQSLVGNSSGWIYLGNLVIPQQGYNASITMEAGLGYNAVATNLGYLKLHIRTSNTTPSGGFYFTAFAEQFGKSINFITEIRITENIATNTYGIYVYCIQFIGIGYYKVEGSGIEYTPVQTATTPPATYYQVPLEFTVNSSTTINNTLTVNGDFRSYNTTTPTTGYLFLGSTGSNYIGYDATKFVVSGNLNATSFIKTGGTSSQFLKADGSVDSTSYGTGSVTSVAMTVPTGLSVSGTPITTSGTLAVTLTAGYSIPTTANQSTWTTAYNRSLTSAAVTGTTTKTLTLNQQDGGTITASWTDINTDAVTSVFGRTGAVVATEGDYTLTQLGDVTITSPTTGQVLKYNGTAWINDTDANTGTVTSVAMTVPTGLSIAGSPITSSGTLAVTFAAGYSIPTTASQSTWDTAYTNRITSLTTTGTSGAATLVSNVLNIPNYAPDLSGYVTLATTQTISGAKTFTTYIEAPYLYANSGGSLFIQNANDAITIRQNSTSNNLTIKFNRSGVDLWKIQTVPSGANEDFKIYNSQNSTNALTIASTGAAIFSSTGLFQGSLLTVGSAVAATNVEFNINGVANKAGRIQFQQSGVSSWLIGNGAASENGNFEIYNANGQQALVFVKATSAATFSSTIQSTHIGINTAPTGARLYTTQTTDGEWIATFKNYGGSSSYGVSIDMSGSTSVQSALQIYTPTGTGFRFHTNGRLTIGTFTDNGYILDASGMIRATGTIRTDQGFTYEGGVINVTGGTTSWIKLGTISIAQGGSTAVITIEGGSGYNADETQNGSARIFIRTSNGSPNGSGWYYSATLTQMGYNSNVASNCIITQTNSTTYDIYVEFGPYSGNTYYKVEGSAFTWTASNSNYGATAPTGGQTLTKVFKVISTATFAGSVTATSFFESSDNRLKTLIKDNYQIKGIGEITPKLYTKNGKVELGYYAQDFIGILDSAISKGSDDMLSLSYREIHTAKIYALEQEIKELKAKLN